MERRDFKPVELVTSVIDLSINCKLLTVKQEACALMHKQFTLYTYIRQ